MLNAIKTHLLDLLQVQALSAGGNAYAAGWLGVQRNAPQPGFVNLFDRRYRQEGLSYRPAIYLGHPKRESKDRRDYAILSGETGTQYRICTIYLVVVVASNLGEQDAANQRDQLVSNVMSRLLPQVAEAGFWYDIAIGEHEDVLEWTSGTPSGAQSVFEAMAALPVCMRYSWSPTSNA